MKKQIQELKLGVVFRAAEIDNVDTAILICLGRVPAFAKEYFEDKDWLSILIADRVLMLTDYLNQQMHYID